jgi:hypothetical protein
MLSIVLPWILISAVFAVAAGMLFARYLAAEAAAQYWREAQRDEAQRAYRIGFDHGWAECQNAADHWMDSEAPE